MSAERKNPLDIDSVCIFLKKLFPAELHHLVWLAGGSVRDTLLGREIRDIDLVALLPAEILESLGFSHVEAVTTTPIWFHYFREYGNVEVTVVNGMAGLAEDLKRRDFTMNAMLMTLDREIIDPLTGQADLKNLLLKLCSDRVFMDDPIRIFRAFRFESEGFFISEETEALIRSSSWDEELERMPVERFSREMLKALQGRLPGRFFLNMVNAGVGRGLLPELFRMPDIPAGPVQYHPEGDLLTHSLQVLDRVSAATGSQLVRFCAFFHDIGKLATEPNLHPSHHGHEENGFKSAEEFCRRLALPSEYGRALAWTSRLHGNANKLAELRPATRIRMAEQAKRGGIAEILPLIAAADKPGNDITAEWDELLGIAMLSMSELAIDMEKLNSMKPEKRSEYILQRRVELLKKSAGSFHLPNPISC